MTLCDSCGVDYPREMLKNKSTVEEYEHLVNVKLLCPLCRVRKRRCTSCGLTYPASTRFFYRKKRGKYGLYSRCKRCADVAEVEQAIPV